MNIKIELSELMCRFNEKHGNKYDYSYMSYERMDRKIKIICPNHGEFYQTPSNHTKKGCLKCGYELNSKESKMKIDEFILRSTKTHGDKYSYESSIYVDYKTKIEISCKKHGKFKIIPILHIRGSGCKLCKSDLTKNKNPQKVDKLNNKQIKFIEVSKKIHNNYYSYKNTKYLKSNIPLIITCPRHGDFEQKPMHHLRGSGCQTCSVYKRNTIEFGEYVSRCNLKFNNKFTYSNYNGISGHVDVSCPIHGINKHLSYNHYISKHGCKICSYSSVIKYNSGRTKGTTGSKGNFELKYTNQEFINLISKKHNNKYDYSLVNYKGMKNKISVICKIHGKFYVESYSHTVGSGCSKCARKSRIKTTEFFIKESNLIHNNTYDYSLSEYIRSSDM